MKSKMTKNLLMATAIASAMGVCVSNALADSAAAIFSDPSSTAVTYDNASGNYPIVSAILSEPGTSDGYTYGSYSFLLEDGTGSLDIYTTAADLGSYTPTVGDALSISGTYSPYHQIPEIETITSVTLESSGNTVPSPTVSTIPTLTASTTIPQSLAGSLFTLENVSLYTDAAATTPVSGSFATHANTTLYAKDADGNIMEIYCWASSYSTVGALGGTTIPTGSVDITGFLSQSGTYPVEMTPYSITSVPEPSSQAMFGVGGLLLALVLRRRSGLLERFK
jgi:hypothetical protein